MTCTILAVASASVTDVAVRAWAGMLLWRTWLGRVYWRTNRMWKLGPYVPFSHYSPQPKTVLLKNLVLEASAKMSDEVGRMLHDS